MPAGVLAGLVTVAVQRVKPLIWKDLGEHKRDKPVGASCVKVLIKVVVDVRVVVSVDVTVVVVGETTVVTTVTVVVVGVVTVDVVEKTRSKNGHRITRPFEDVLYR